MYYNSIINAKLSVDGHPEFDKHFYALLQMLLLLVFMVLYTIYNGCCCCRCSGNYVVSTSLLLFLFSLVLLYRILKECFGSLLFSIYVADVVVSCNASLFLTNHNGFSWNDFQTSGQRRKKLYNNNNNISSHQGHGSHPVKSVFMPGVVVMVFL